MTLDRDKSRFYSDCDKSRKIERGDNGEVTTRKAARKTTEAQARGFEADADHSSVQALLKLKETGVIINEVACGSDGVYHVVRDKSQRAKHEE